MHESIIRALPSFPALLQYYHTSITQYTTPLTTSRLYAIHHTILARTISCKGRRRPGSLSSVARAASSPARLPSNLPRGFQRFGFEYHFRAGGFSDLGYGVGLLMVQSSPGVHPKPRFGPNLDSTDRRPQVSRHHKQTHSQITHNNLTQTNTCMHAQTQTQAHTDTDAGTHRHRQTDTGRQADTRTHARTHAHACTHRHRHNHTHTHTHTHTHARTIPKTC